jgi:acetyltransferase
MILFGAGGSLVEALQDRAIALPPLNQTLARRLMERTLIFSALSGRGRRAQSDLGALSQALVHFSHLAAEQRAIAEIDINPLVASEHGVLALDARIVLHRQSIEEAQLPSLAIRPYPAEYVEEGNLPRIGDVVIRPIRPEDEELLAAFHAGLSDRSVHQRYFGNIPLRSRIAHSRLARICFADYDREIALVAEHRLANVAPEIIAIARFIRTHGRRDAQFGLTVADAWQGRGLGTLLLGRLVEVARREKLSRLHGTVLAGNTAMLRVCDKVGFTLKPHPEDGEVAVEIQL